MKNLLTLILILLSNSLFCQVIDQIGQLKLVDCKIIKTENVIDTISGQPINMVRLTVTAIVQNKTNNRINEFSGNSKNKYKPKKFKFIVSYAFDSTGLVCNAIFNEIKQYATEKEAWAKEHNHDNDFRALPYDKTFLLNDTIATPYINTLIEFPEPSRLYELFYIDKQVYIIEPFKRKDSLYVSSIVLLYIFFIKDNERLKLGVKLNNIDQVKRILEEKI